MKISSDGLEVEVGDMFMFANPKSTLFRTVFVVDSITDNCYFVHTLTNGNRNLTIHRYMNENSFIDFIGVSWKYLGHLIDETIKSVKIR